MVDADATAACSLGRKPCRFPQIWLEARSPRRQPSVTECLRELSRFAAKTLRGNTILGLTPAYAQGYVLSSLRDYVLVVNDKDYAQG